MAKATDDDEILREARERFKQALDADAENRSDALDDIRFAWNLNNYQWDQQAKKARKGRPMLTENRLPQFIRQVVNGQRQNRPSISVAPANSGAAVETSKVIEGMIRHIQQWSRADLAYDSAFEGAVTGGIGYFRVATEYVDDDGYDQEICIRAIDNPFRVYDDPEFQEPDGSDRKWCFVTEWIDRDAIKAEYGIDPTDLPESGAGDDAMQEWFEADRVQVAEYWRVRIEKETKAEEAVEGSTEKPRSREVKRKVVEQFLLTGDRIIKRADWAGCYIPIIPVFGEVKNIEGKKYRKSLIRDAKEPQRINNYFLSAEVEATALQPKAPFIGPVGAFETDGKKWASANADNHAYLQYDGEVPPQRQPPPAFPAALREVRMAAIEAMKSTMGVYDASLGARSNETSGVAIEARAAQGDQSTYHYIDNMVRAIRYAGTVIIDLLPKVYDAPRVVRILEPDGEPQMVAVNHVFDAPIDPYTMQPMRSYDIKSGRYDVVVTAGPSFQTQRQENTRAITELVKAFPPLAQVAGDLLLKNMDFPDADKIAERLKGMFDKTNNGLPPAVQQQMQQMQQVIEQGTQKLQQLQQQVAKQELELKSKDIERLQLQTVLKMRDMQPEEPASVIKEREVQKDLAIAQMEDRRERDIATLRANVELRKAQMSSSSADLGALYNPDEDPNEAQSRYEQERQQKAGAEEQRRASEEQRAARRDAVQEQLAQAMMQMLSNMQAPKEIVRGPDGRAIGVRSVTVQ